MIKDRGPIFQLGYGVQSRQLGYDEAEVEGVNPESGFVSKALHHHPVMRFFATTAVTIAGMAVASSVVREGGVRLGMKLQESGKPWVTTAIKDLRQIQQQFDKWQGVERIFADGAEDYASSTKLFVRDGNKILRDQVDQRTGFFFTQAEKEAGRSGVEGPVEWTMKNEIQQKLVASARRLPYELPTAYFVQRALTDKLFGSDDKFEGHWYNPLDVMTDFVTKSVQNTAMMIAPFEAGGASLSQSWRKLMSYGDDFTNLAPRQAAYAKNAIVLKDVLGRVGHDATTLLNRGMKFSAQTTGAMSAGLQEARQGSYSLTQYLYETRNARAQAGLQGKVLGAIKDRLKPEVLDLAPGPFKGGFSGVQAAKQRFKEIGAGYDAFERLMELGRSGYDDMLRVERAAGGARATKADFLDKSLKAHLASSGTPIEELATQINLLGGGGYRSPAFKNSPFFQGQIQNEYNKLVHDRLVREGMSVDGAKKLTSMIQVTRPGEKAFDTHITNRIRFGDEVIKADTADELYSEIYRRTGTSFSAQDHDIITGKLKGIVSYSDDVYADKAYQAAMSRKIRGQWKLAEERVLPQLGDDILSKSKPEYNNFLGRIDKSHQDFLKRRTAQRTGLKLTDQYGSPVADSIIDSHLTRMKFDPLSDMHKMRAYLTTKGDIAKPWQKGGYNIFGLKPLTVAEASEKGYFRSSEHNEQQVNRLVNRMGTNDPVPLASYTLGGVYKTSSGRVIDFNIAKQGFNKFMNKMAEDTQIPLIHMSPLKLLGYSGKQDITERSILQYVPGMSNQAFLGRAYGKDDFYLWTKKAGRGSKGNVFAFGVNQSGYVTSTTLDGTYRPFAAKAGNIASRHAKLAIGDLGNAPLAPREIDKNSWAYKLLGADKYSRLNDRYNAGRRVLKINDDQPDSVFRMLGRLKGRRTDINNPIVMAQYLRDGKISVKGSTRYLHDSGGILDDAGRVVHTPQEVAAAFDKFSNQLRRRGFSRKTVRGFGDNPNLSKVFTEDFTGSNARTFDATAAVDVTKFEKPQQLLEAMNITARKDATWIDKLAPEKRAAAERARKSLIYRHLGESGSSQYWDRGLPNASGSTSIHVRMDELKLDYMKYLMIKAGLKGGSGDFATLINDASENLLTLRRAGKISQAELIEARSALLSTQINYQSFIGYDRTVSSLANAKAVSSAVAGNGLARDALSDIAAGNLGNRGTRFDSLMPFLRKRLGSASYDYPGDQYNPFGHTNTVFVPTFGTAFARDQWGAVKSVAGIKTWDNPQAFSGSSIPMSHFVERLNKYSSTFGLGLDPTQFRGPIDMYASGMVARRALPLVAAGTTALAVDRTIGGFANGKDKNGERVYSPFFLGIAAKGAVEAQAAVAAIPGGMSYKERREQLLSGEVPVRAGRWWPLGNAPFEGGRIQYFRPSWYRRMQGAYQYTDQTFGSPMERLGFGYDFSPLRPLDPYRFEKEHYYDRPYPSTGDYFTGPWGPITPLLNATAGKILKPHRTMHEGELDVGLSSYVPVGEQGVFMPSGTVANSFGTGGGMVSGPISGGGGAGVGGTTGGAGGGIQGGQNATYAAASGSSLNTAKSIVTRDIGAHNNMYSQAAAAGPMPSGEYGIGNESNVMRPTIMTAAKPMSRQSFQYQMGELGYRTQELFGIYGFTFASARQALGFGNKDFTPERPVLASANAAYGSTRGFWDLNLGGLGDMPLPLEGNYANIEMSEIIRRFIPKERTDLQVLNPIPNLMSIDHPWLPGSDYYLNFKQGDPYTKIQEGEMRLPGAGFERYNQLHPDQSGNYGLVDQHKILGDVAPWSTEYKQVDRLVDRMGISGVEQTIVDRTREQVAAKSIKNEFSPYEYKYASVEDTAHSPLKFSMGKAWEWFAHRDTFFNTKFLPERTAVEDWERQNVYGATFPQWEHPIEDFLKPVAYKATQRNPVAAALVTGTLGSLFGRTPAAKTVGSIVGGSIGLAASAYGRTYEMVTGDRYIPGERRKQIALEEYTDILNYTKNMRLYKQAEAAGDMENATRFSQQAQQTMYGADIYNGDINQLAMAIPKRKREHFRAMVNAPEQERDQILSTAGRLERRIYEAAWGRRVEERPDLENYFKQHELPAADWEGWHPNTNMDDVKIKIAQSMGIELSELGYYPQEIREANLLNPAYPSYSGGVNSNSGTNDTVAQLRRLMSQQGIRGSVTPVATPYNQTRIQYSGGLLSGV